MNTRATDVEIPFACNPKALNATERDRYKVVTQELLATKKEVKELPDGFGLRFESDSENIRKVAEFVAFERACCPFFDFEMTVGKNNGDLWLNIRGREGVKDFIRSEFGI
ncbi:MAG: hypothetical protein ABI999_15070 [Acidobacteriota bacterium]